MMRPFVDRRDAGRRLARRLMAYATDPPPLVLALPRGGVPVGFEVAAALGAPLDVCVVRKLGVPGHEELAMGAIASGGAMVLYRPTIEAMGIPPVLVESVARREAEELERRERAYRGDRPPISVSGQVVILVDDGMATGSTMRAAAMSLRQHNPRKLVVAVPVAAMETCQEMHAVADEVVCAETPVTFHAVGLWYEDFSQTTDDEVRELLAEAQSPGIRSPGKRSSRGRRTSGPC